MPKTKKASKPPKKDVKKASKPPKTPPKDPKVKKNPEDEKDWRYEGGDGNLEPTYLGGGSSLKEDIEKGVR